MSQVTLEFSIVGDTPTQVILLDDTATYGVKRNDTNGVVVAAGTPMVAGAPGVWTYTFTEPLIGLAYTYSMQYTFADGAVGYVTGVRDATIHAVAPSDIQKQFGTVNINTWADKDATGDVGIIAAAIDFAQTLADKRIALRAQELRAPLPLVGSVLYSGLQDYATTYAGILLYQGRGEPTSGSRGEDGAGLYSDMLSKAEDQLTACLVANRELLGQTGTFESAPAAIASGTNQTWADRLPLQPFGWRLPGAYWPYG